MCKFCEDTEAIWLRKKNIMKGTIGEYCGEEKVLAAIIDMEVDDFFRNKSYFTVNINSKESEKANWFDIKINYCPFCGKKLRSKTLSNTIKAIINYIKNK